MFFGHLERLAICADGRFASLEVFLQFLQAILAHGHDGVFNDLGVLLKEGSQYLFVDRWHILLVDARFLQGLLYHKITLCPLAVHCQIKGAAVGATNALDPTIRRVNLGVPTVASIMRHLIVHMLPEAKALRVNSDSFEEQEDATEEVTKSLVVNHATRHSLTDRLLGHSRLTTFLHVRGEKWKGERRNFLEARVRLVVRINKVFNLRHSKLTHTKQAGTWTNFIAETLADLGTCEWHAAIVKVKQALKVDKVTLGRLRTKIALSLTSRADRALEHQVELCWL